MRAKNSAVANFRRSSINDTFLYIVFCIYHFWDCKLHFSSMTLCTRVALKSRYLFVVGANQFLVNQNVKYKCFHCAFQIFQIFAGSVYTFVNGGWRCFKIAVYKTNITMWHEISHYSDIAWYNHSCAVHRHINLHVVCVSFVIGSAYLYIPSIPLLCISWG